MDELVDILVQTELERFSANDYRGLPDAPPFQIVEGDLPALVSAPHAVTHWRNGRTKPSDDYTGAIALALARACGCSAMVASRFDRCDPNWDPYESSAYKRALCAYVHERDVRLVLDIHGMPAASPDAVEVGSADGATVVALPGADARACSLLRERLAPYLERYEKDVSLNGPHAARGENTVTRTVARECGIAALQVELNTRFRVPSGAGAHVPEGNPLLFSAEQIPHEWQARMNPDPACVETTIRALAAVIRELVGQTPCQA